MSMPAAISLDLSACITGLNQPAERMLSVDGAAAIGRPVPAILGPSLADRLTGLLLHGLRGGGAPQRVIATLPDGRRATLRASLGPVRDTSGATTGLLLILDEVASGPALPVAPPVSLIGVGGERRTLSILHADVRGFTSIAERMDPGKLTVLLLRYHEAAARALREAGATVDRFVGDAVLAFWNAPVDQADHARRAIRGALAMLSSTDELGGDMRYGVGLHLGEALVGDLGNAELRQYTAIGDAVNVAARLQGHAEAGSVVCSTTLLDAAGPGVRAVSLGALALKGRSSSVDSHRVISIDSDDGWRIPSAT